MITKSDIRFLKLAEAMSNYSDYRRIHIGSCVVNKKSIVSTGCNKSKTHSEQLKYNHLRPSTGRLPWLHSEMDSLIKAGEEAEGATLYVFRRGRDGILRDCKPCPACMGKIKDSGIKRVVYTTVEGIDEIAV